MHKRKYTDEAVEMHIKALVSMESDKDAEEAEAFLLEHGIATKYAFNDVVFLKLRHMNEYGDVARTLTSTEHLYMLGFLVVPVIDPDELDMFREGVFNEAPEIIPKSGYPASVSSNYLHAHPSSFHNKWIRCMRTRAHNAVLSHLTGAFISGNEYMSMGWGQNACINFPYASHWSGLRRDGLYSIGMRNRYLTGLSITARI